MFNVPLSCHPGHRSVQLCFTSSPLITACFLVSTVELLTCATICFTLKSQNHVSALLCCSCVLHTPVTGCQICLYCGNKSCSNSNKIQKGALYIIFLTSSIVFTLLLLISSRFWTVAVLWVLVRVMHLMPVCQCERPRWLGYSQTTLSSSLFI